MAKEVKVSQGTIFMIFCKDLQMSPYKHVQTQLLLAKTTEKHLTRAKILQDYLQEFNFLVVFFFRVGKKYASISLVWFWHITEP